MANTDHATENHGVPGSSPGPPLKLSSDLQENVVVSYAARYHRAAEKNDVPGEQLGVVVGMARFSKCRERRRLAKEP